MTTVPWRSVGGSGRTDVLSGRTGEKHVSRFQGCQTSSGLWNTSFHTRFCSFSRYGTGCFLLRNTGTKVNRRRIVLKALVKCGAALYRRSPFLLQPVMSDHGLLTTVAYKLGRDKPAFYALEVFKSPQLCRCSVFGFTAVLFSLLLRVLWPSPGPWSVGYRTIWGSSDPPRSSVR